MFNIMFDLLLDQRSVQAAAQHCEIQTDDCTPSPVVVRLSPQLILLVR